MLAAFAASGNFSGDAVDITKDLFLEAVFLELANKHVTAVAVCGHIFEKKVCIR